MKVVKVMQLKMLSRDLSGCCEINQDNPKPM